MLTLGKFKTAELISLILVLTIILLNLTSYKHSSFGTSDFIQYWSAGQFWLEGSNPYNPIKMFELQKSQNLCFENPVMMWNPPWTLFFFLHLLFLPFLLAAKVWLLTKIVFLYFSAFFISEALNYKFKPGLMLAFFSLFFFYPVISCLQWGQVGILMLFGVSGFFYSVIKRKDTLAGIFLVILSIKPHLFSLLFIAVLYEVFKFKRWNIVKGSLVGLTSLTISSYLVSPVGLRDWIASLFPKNLGGEAVRVTSWKVATFSGFIREKFYNAGIYSYDKQISLTVLILGVILFLTYLYKRKESVNWKIHLVPILAFSFFIAPHGWPYDFSSLAIGQLVVLVLCLENKKNKKETFKLFLPLLILQFLCFLLISLGINEQQKYFWFPAAYGLLYVIATNKLSTE